MQTPKSFQLEWAGRQLQVEVGRLAAQAHGACTVQYGDTVVLATVVQGASPRDGVEYFPLLVDFEEKMYAAGKIKGSRFIKREGRASDEAILTARLIDRSLRPLFEEKERRDLQIVLTMISYDGVNDPDIPSLIAASIALEISPVSWFGPVAGVNLGYIDNEFVINPTNEQRSEGDLDLVVVASKEGVVMIEAESSQVDDDTVASGIDKAHEALTPVFDFIDSIRKEVGVPKKEKEEEVDEESAKEKSAIADKVKSFIKDAHLETLFPYKDKHEYKEKLRALEEKLDNQLKEDSEVSKEMRVYGISMLDEAVAEIARERTLETNVRVDGRGLDELRYLAADVGLYPRVHGTGLFQRGETQVLSVVTLGAPGDEQILDTMELDTTKRYFHHYNFPGFSVGEVKPMRGPGRREIGHGALAEKALVPVLPNKDDFPYTIRVVSEIMSSNGSTSQASVCGSTLSLMDAGVPITDMVAGISIGLMSNPEKPEDYRLLTDIQGLEDHVGDMDFKVAGTEKGVTAIQLDIKLHGISLQVCKEAIVAAREARLKILDVMKSAISEPRSELSQYAPRITSFYIKPDQIRDVIGSGGKTIREIIDTTGVEIDIEQDGLVMVTSEDGESAERAIQWIKDLTHEVAAGEVYKGKVTRIMDFGAFVEILPGQEGLIHISELAWEHVPSVEDVVKMGDEVEVKVKEIDEQGRINLSRKALLERPKDLPPRENNNRDSKPRGGNGRGGGHRRR
ncbi:MAG: polyribonucleotide nucleotidyltransferase [Patescibacteria group bacterium]